MTPDHIVFGYTDIQIEIQPVEFDDIANTIPAESSSSIRERVIKASIIQQERFKGDKEKLAYYEQDYEWIPRRRVNFNEKENHLRVMTGDWFDQYPQLKDEILIEFQLPSDKTVFLKGEHWQLGHGWSEDLYK